MTAVKTAIDIANKLKNVDTNLHQAQLKSSLADMISALADAKIAMAELQTEIHNRDKEIDKLQKELSRKSRLVRSGSAYYDIDDSGNRHGDPYCQVCYESNDRLIHIVPINPGEPSFEGRFICQVCKNVSALN